MRDLMKILSLVVLAVVATSARAKKTDKKQDFSELVDDKTIALAQKILDLLKDSKKDDKKPSNYKSKPSKLEVSNSKFDYNYEDYGDDYDSTEGIDVYDDHFHDDNSISTQHHCKPQKNCEHKGHSSHSCKGGHSSSCHSRGSSHSSCRSSGSQRGHSNDGCRRGHREGHGGNQKGVCSQHKGSGVHREGRGGNGREREEHHGAGKNMNGNGRKKTSRKSNSNDELLYPIQRPNNGNADREPGKGYGYH